MLPGNEGSGQRPIPRTGTGLGLRGNQSGPIQVENAVLPPDAIVGPVGDGPKSNDECVDPFFLICSSSCWNGIALATIDIAKNHTTRKVHSDVGMRVADYPTIQDYVGECIHGHQRLPRPRVPDGAGAGRAD